MLRAAEPLEPQFPHLENRNNTDTSRSHTSYCASGVSPVGRDGLSDLPYSNNLRVFHPKALFLVETGEAPSPCAWVLFPLSFPSYLSASFLSISFFPRLKWIMRSLITKTWQLSPRLNPSTRYNAPTSFPTSLIPDTRLMRCWRDVAMERYGILPLSLGPSEERRAHGVPCPLYRRHLAFHSVAPGTLLSWSLQSTFKTKVISSQNWR